MNSFIANDCRLCSQTFCCETCRRDHEKNRHDVNPDCDICIYGRAVLKEATASLLKHIKKSHWPLHCVFCKKMFDSLDEIIQHEKCPGKNLSKKSPGTPVTPSNKSSPFLTPFYKKVEAQHVALQGGFSLRMGITSTPLQITPTDQGEIRIFKSSLKLTGSGTLNESRKSDRRVTFLDTPLLEPNVVLKRAIEDKINSIERKTEREAEPISLVAELYETAPTSANLSEGDGNVDGTVWESALMTAFDLNISTSRSSLEASCKSEQDLQVGASSNPSWGILQSVANVVKSVMQNISISSQESFSNKRSRLDSDETDNFPATKKLKLIDIKCRRTLRPLGPLYALPLKPRCVDKATQTDDYSNFDFQDY